MDFLNPFTYLGSAAGRVVADGWTAAMLGLWNAGLWLLKLVLTIVDAFTVPDLREGGPGAHVYQITFWIAGALMLLLAMVQLGLTAARRDGKSMARVLVGTGQFVMVWAGWIALAVLVVAACGGLTRALMSTLLHIDGWAQFDPLGTQISTQDISDGTIATVLGFMGIFMVFAAIGHLLVMLTRAGALMVLAATTPIAAGGLVSDAGQGWFWKSLRWFIAAAFTPVVMVLVLGIGVQMTSGVATGMSDTLQKAIGTAVPGVVLICIGCFSPLALFKLLAFVDPGTSSGSALRAGLAAQGGLSGVLAGQGQAQGGSSAASSTDTNGRSQGESSGQDSTSARFSSGGRGLMGQVGGGLGQAVGAGMAAMESIGPRGAAVAADVTNQMGVGHNNYVPDFSKTKQVSSHRSGGTQADDDNPQINGSSLNTTPEAGITPPAPPGVGTPPAPTPSPGAVAGSAGGAGGAGAAGGEAAGAAAAVPIVPV
ncbi:hypothetical protein SAMN04489867_3140 [Pedococcus dokdonensis]|uniref:TrbL/VirB6 plasmid conjugal transfer protein n=1 Tax=Pedococcus dokdonensis TaxID=443156 RepID=A0A1H0U657_9MICO|nr:type IV secretion system protein [Pedococcus dokdonensis]SDP61316.1 hypothetical protein SAMN04489867_3140 [Pedococcus dokdonensis]